jgi:PAS domain-containing protein
MIPRMRPALEWASFLVSRRAAIDRALAARLGDAAPSASSPESEALRRFRSFAAAALRRGGDAAAPALDGLRVEAGHAARVLEGWCAAAVELAGTGGSELRELLDPLAARFESALAGAGMARQARRAPRVGRRAVVAAIDRIADAFLAVDLEDGRVVDANPAAAALLSTPRDALLGSEARRFLHADTRAIWREELEGLVDSDEPRRFRAILVDALARPVAIEAHATRASARERVLALVVARVL